MPVQIFVLPFIFAASWTIGGPSLAHPSIRKASALKTSQDKYTTILYVRTRSPGPVPIYLPIVRRLFELCFVFCYWEIFDYFILSFIYTMYISLHTHILVNPVHSQPKPFRHLSYCVLMARFLSLLHNLPRTRLPIYPYINT